MKKFNKILWGLVLIALGTFFALNILNVIDVNIFFKGWWTLLIIVPAFIGILTTRDTVSNLIILLVGVGLLLASRDVFSFGTFWKLCVPVIIIIIGLRIIFGAFFKKPKREYKKDSFSKGGKAHFVLFSSSDVDYSDEKFSGNSLIAIFSGIECHLENASIENGATIEATGVFGGIEIYLPKNVNVEVSSSCFLGNVENAKKGYVIQDAPTVYVKCSSVFGSIEIH